MSLWDKVDRKYINKDNLTKDYYKFRNAAFEFKDNYLNPTWQEKLKDKTDDVFWGIQKYKPGDNTLSYQMAARQITVGDIDDAADFISVILNNGGEVSTIKRTLKTNYSPCGPVKMDERNNFFNALGKDGNKARTLQDKWEQQMQLAITKAQSIKSNTKSESTSFKPLYLQD